MNLSKTRTRALAVAGILGLALAVNMPAANAGSFGGGTPPGQASPAPSAGDAQTAGLLDWLYCTRVGKPSPC